MLFAPLGDVAVVATLGERIDEPTLRRVRALADALLARTSEGVIDVVPAYTTVTVFYDPVALSEESPFARTCRIISECAAHPSRRADKDLSPDRVPRRRSRSARTFEIPVCYGGEFGPDLEGVARHAKLRAKEVIELHSHPDYHVCAIGFTPGFPYLSGLPEKLHTPRRPTPRVKVPAGSVGIGGMQTGVYSLPTPGGWQLIGRTPLTLFDLSSDEPALLQVGDEVNFRPISPEEFSQWK
jgi:inhibitor of KinA